MYRPAQIVLIFSALFLNSAVSNGDEISKMEKEVDSFHEARETDHSSAYGFIPGAKEMREAGDSNIEKLSVGKYQYVEVAPTMKAQVSKKKYNKAGRLIAYTERPIEIDTADMSIKLRPSPSKPKRRVYQSDNGPKAMPYKRKTSRQ